MRLHAPRHAGRALAYCVPGADPGRVVFDASGHVEVDEKAGHHLIAHGGGLIWAAAPEVPTQQPILPAESSASEGESPEEADGGEEADGAPPEGAGRRRRRRQSL